MATSPRRSRSKSSSKNSSRRPKSPPEENGAPLLPVVPLRGMVAFPSMVVPLFVGREKSIAAIDRASQFEPKLVFLVAQRDEENEEPEADELYSTGIVAEIMQSLRLPDGNLRVVVEGRGRAVVREFREDDEVLSALLDAMPEHEIGDSNTNDAIARHLRENFGNAVSLSRRIPPEAAQNLEETSDAGELADLIVSFLDLEVEQRQQALETRDALERAHFVAGLLAREVEMLQLDHEIEMQVKEGISENQREYFLRERLRSIQEKLGERDPNARDGESLREKIEAANMPTEAHEKAIYELDRLERMPPVAPEVAMLRNYIELMVELPWDKRTEDNLDLEFAQEVLDDDHYALGKIKERIVEFLAVRQLNPQSRGPILCFMGPPGVGKTSIGKSIAKSLGREFVRVSVGGIHDEAEVRGHRRTYIGSMPGRIIAALRRVKTKNPVFLLDEIDKLSHDYRGDPSSALLEALDPEQNVAFADHYLEVPFDLSEVMFIATGNLLDPIQPALRDRMEVLTFPGYTENEKKQIATGFLIPKQLKENGISEAHLEFSDAGLGELVRGYTREAGVRNLEREIGTVCRKIARQVASLQSAANKQQKAEEEAKSVKRRRKNDESIKAPIEFEKVVIEEGNLQEFLGPRKYSRDLAQERDEIGVAQGLAWTEAGGEVLPIEVLLTPGNGNAKSTGNLGNVMKESCETAMTYARAHASELGIKADFAATHDAHIHVPSGAVPKDGPSAGVAITVALVSAMAARPARKEVAMTGEISLRGHVMAVGGVKEKILAAHRVGATEILLPHENERDLEELPKEVRDALKFHIVKTLNEALAVALYPIEAPEAILKDKNVETDDLSDADRELLEKSETPEPSNNEDDEAFEIPKLEVAKLEVDEIETGELNIEPKRKKAKPRAKK